MIASLEAALGQPVSRETIDRLECYEASLRSEARSQNLIAASTIDLLWQRHLIDSAQLGRFHPGKDASWIDLGSGAGLPGIVLAILLQSPMTLVEPRRLRAGFLRAMVRQLNLDHADVQQRKAEQVAGQYDVITGRAVAKLDSFLRMSIHLAQKDTLWVLPKGRSAKSELAEAERSWHYDLRVEQSCTDADSSILLLNNVRAKGKA